MDAIVVTRRNFIRREEWMLDFCLFGQRVGSTVFLDGFGFVL